MPPAIARENLPFRGKTLHMKAVSRDVLLITLDRPEELNVISLAFIEELSQALHIAKAAPPRALVLVGSGRAFCAGADLKTIASPEHEFCRSPLAFRDRFLLPLAHLFNSMEEMPFPIIAAINGLALGGGFEMALSADLRVMSQTASLGVPEVTLGAIPGAGGVQKLIRHVGRSKALEWILLGSRIGAQEAKHFGLVAEVAAPEQLLDRALDLAARLTQTSPTAIAQAKASVYLSEDADLRTATKFGVEALTALAGTAEWKEGVTAFMEKRSPQFR